MAFSFLEYLVLKIFMFLNKKNNFVHESMFHLGAESLFNVNV